MKRIGLIAASLVTAALAHGATAQAATYPDAVVLVSGFTTTTPFTTPDPSCNGKEGLTWNVPTGPAAALKAAGNKVFTAPVRHLADPLAQNCTGTVRIAHDCVTATSAPPVGSLLTYYHSTV